MRYRYVFKTYVYPSSELHAGGLIESFSDWRDVKSGESIPVEKCHAIQFDDPNAVRIRMEDLGVPYGPGCTSRTKLGDITLCCTRGQHTSLHDHKWEDRGTPGRTVSWK